MNSLETTVQKIKQHLRLTSRSPIVQLVRPGYDLLLNGFYGRRGLVRVINNEEMIRVRPAHRWADEAYEPEVFAYLKRRVRPGSVVLEIGAHVGVFTVLLARWASPSGKVFAFEPTPQTRAALVDHLVLNGVANQVTIVPMAVSDANGTAVLYTQSNSPENTLSTSHHRIPCAKSVEIGVTTVDAFCQAERIVPTLIKIDIEGFEIHALRGARETLTRHRPHVVVELHPVNWPEIGVDADQFDQVLTGLRYRVLRLDGQADPLAEYGHVVLEPIP
jgi:FkbM family methyltransferase